MNNTDAYFFHQGTHCCAYKFMGVSVERDGESYRYFFRVWAPNATSVALVSDFSGWDTPFAMTRVTDKGIYEAEYISEHALDGASYKYRIWNGERVFDKGDPYAAYSLGGADGASVIFSRKYSFGDEAWMERRKRISDPSGYAYPMNIYEIHLGSFLRHDDNTYYTYREYAQVLPKYLKRMGYTHVELMPLAEYPYDGSWGYQSCAFFAPTSRFGDPDDLRYLIDSLHRAGIGVILDWVGAHFPKDAWGLYEFDGAPLYEYQGRDRMESETWGTRFFDTGREEVQSFLISSVMLWIDEFHVDAIRVDAVASMLYLDYDRHPGEWIPNVDGTNINIEAASFLQKLNSVVHEHAPDVLMIAEESGSYGAITDKINERGLGFDLKWNMGFANDLYGYLETDPIFRKYKHSALTFPIMYAYEERFCLPISHDEVVHGKRSFADKPFGNFEDKLSEARSALMLIMTFPGKKLMFMGTEYAQMREWDYASSLEWFMLDFEKHSEFREYVSELNRFYLATPELWEMDYSREGFSWILADEKEKNTIAYRRFGRDGGSVDVIINFSGQEVELDVPTEGDGRYLRLFDTGNIARSSEDFKIEKTDRGHSAHVYLPKFAGIIMKVDDGRLNFEI